MKCPACGGTMARNRISFNDPRGAGYPHLELWYCKEKPGRGYGCGYWIPCNGEGKVPELPERCRE